MTVAWLALRELWISFRLVALLAAFILGVAAVALVPASLETSLLRLGVVLAAAGGLAAVLLAWTFAAERRRGRARWLVGRAVPRRALLAGWLLAASVTVIGALGPSGLLAWASLGPAARALDPVAFGVTLGAIWASTLALLALALLAGTLLAPLPAASILLVIGAAVSAAVILLPEVEATLPGSAFGALATLNESSRPVARAVQIAGAALATSAVLLVIAGAALERRDL